MLGHDSDADVGYVSEHEDPVDVVRESFRPPARAGRLGFETSRYSGAAFRVQVAEGDGVIRGLDVFGGFLTAGASTSWARSASSSSASGSTP